MAGSTESGDSASSAATIDTVSVLFTDVAGSTELRSRLGEEAADRLRRRHDALVASAIEADGGRIVKGLGDGALAVFRSAAQAVAAAVAIQQAVERHNRSDRTATLGVRVGISCGDVTVEDGDVFGTPVIEAARLCASAEPAQILTADVVRVLARGRGGHEFCEVGTLDLKGLPDPVETVAVAWRAADAGGTGPAFPPPLEVAEGVFPFRGRTVELASLEQTWKNATTTSRRACVLIAGEPGEGKTRLAGELARRAFDHSALVLFGRCDEELAIPYQPFVEALAHHVNHLEDVDALGTASDELIRLVPAVAGLVPDAVAAPATGDAEVDQYRLFEAVDAWLRAASGSGGLVLVLDDLHWATKPTLLMLRHLLRGSQPAPLLVLGTYRDTDLDRTHPLAELLADLRRTPGVERLALHGLELAEVLDLMTAIAGHDLGDEGRELAAALHAETEGNPFFLGELLRNLAESGVLQQQDGRWVVTQQISDVRIPDGIREVVGRRLGNLSSAANDVLAWTAVIGREFTLDVAAAVAGGEDRCLDALDEAVTARLVEETGPATWRFSHALVRSALLDELRTTRRLRMHLTVAQAYEAARPGDTAALAYHFSEAAPLGVADRAVHYLLLAGDMALERLAIGEAEERYSQAVEVIDDVGLDDDAARCDALLGLARARRMGGGDWRTPGEAAALLAERMADGERLSAAILSTNRGWWSIPFGVNDALIARIERALELLSEGDGANRARMLALLAVELHFTGDIPRIRALMSESIAMARRMGDHELLFDAIVRTSTCVNVAGYYDELLARRDEAAELLPSVADNTLIGLYQRLASIFCSLVGDTADWERRLIDLREDPAIRDMRLVRWVERYGTAGLHLLRGEVDEGVRAADESLLAAEAANEEDGPLYYFNLHGNAMRMAGRHDEEIPTYRELLATAVHGHHEIATGFMHLLAESGALDEARELAPLAFGGFRDHKPDVGWLPVAAVLAMIACELELRDEAEFMLGVLEPHRRWWATWTGLAGYGPVPFALGRLRALLGDSEGADVEFAESERRCREAGAQFFLAETLLYRALAKPDTPEARKWLEEARLLAEAGGYGLVLARVRAALA